jgi:hypothetical protein
MINQPLDRVVKKRIDFRVTSMRAKRDYAIAYFRLCTLCTLWLLSGIQCIRSLNCRPVNDGSVFNLYYFKSPKAKPKYSVKADRFNFNNCFKD